MTSTCRICHRRNAFFTCDRCKNDFCDDHINDHDDENVSKKISNLIEFYRQNPDEYPLIERINRWEKQSIERIQQRANEIRKEIFRFLDKHFKQMENSFKHFDKQIDLFNDLLLKPRTIRLKETLFDENSSFISPMSVEIVQENDLFARSAGNIRIVDEGQRIIHSQWSDHAAVRGQIDYFSGQHSLRFQIEDLSPDRWAFFGIISQQTKLNPISISTPTVFGFAGQNGICRNGIYQIESEDIYPNEFETNEIFQLFLNCDEQQIRLTNERTNRSHQLDIDPTECPLPWNFLIGLCCAAGDSIRILSSNNKF